MLAHQNKLAQQLRFAVALLLFATGAALAAPPPTTGTLLLQVGEQRLPATLLNTDVSLNVNGLVARVSVMQKFENTSPDWVEGVYVFPLPDRAAVDHMRLYIGDRFIEGEIREKEAARRSTNRRNSPASAPAWSNSSGPTCLRRRSPTSGRVRPSWSRSSTSRTCAMTPARSACGFR